MIRLSLYLRCEMCERTEESQSDETDPTRRYKDMGWVIMPKAPILCPVCAEAISNDNRKFLKCR